jgi:hypothetical protein
LCSIVHVLELAAATCAEERAGSLNPKRRSFVNIADLDTWRAWFPPAATFARTRLRWSFNGKSDTFSRQASRNA